MAYRIIFQHLAVGQGLAGFTDLHYEGDGRFLALIDLGSSAGGKDFYQISLDKIMEAITENSHILDYVHISHLDDDHYNLFHRLGEQYFLKHGVKIVISRFGIGGAAMMTEDEINAFIQENFDHFQLPPFYYTDNGQGFFRTGNPYTPFVMDQYMKDWDVSFEIEPLIDFRINILFYRACFFEDVFNRLSNKPAEFINTGSTMILISLVRVLDPSDRSNVEALVSYLFTGDATIDTLKQFLNVGKFNFQNERKSLLIPHHGTKLHIADNPDTDDPTTFITLNRFLRNFPPIAANVSAKCTMKPGWIHPHIHVMKLINNILPVPGTNHDVTAFEMTDELVVRQLDANHLLWATFGLDGVGDGDPYESERREYFHLYDCGMYYDPFEVSSEELNNDNTRFVSIL